ncbi:MAG: SIR2 family protein [Candidatus Parvarchaeota archaeon]
MSPLLPERLSFAIRNHAKIVFLVGAGISRSAGIPTATEIVEILRKEYHLDPARKYTYSEAFKAALPGTRNRGERRSFIERQCSGKSPKYEHHALIHLLERNVISAILTTNFDHLLEGAAIMHGGNPPWIYDYNVNTEPIEFVSKYPKIVKLHGDFLYDDIANLPKEIQQRLTQNMRYRIKNYMKGSHLVVLGYSGNDRSLMKFIIKTVHDPELEVAGIYWVRHSFNSVVSQWVKKLEMVCSSKGIFEYVGPATADTFLKEFVANAGINVTPTRFGIHEIWSQEPELFPQFVTTPLQYPPVGKKPWLIWDKRTIQGVRKLLESYRVVVITGLRGGDRSSLLGALISSIGPTRGLYIDLRFLERPVHSEFMSHLVRFAMGTSPSPSESKLTEAFRRGSVIAIDGLDNFVRIGEIQSVVLTLIKNAVLAQNGAVVLALSHDNMQELVRQVNNQPWFVRQVNNPPWFELRLGVSGDSSSTEAAQGTEISESDLQLLRMMSLFRIAEPLSLIRSVRWFGYNFKKGDFHRLAKLGYLIERDGKFVLSSPYHFENPTETELLSIASAYETLSKASKERRLHNYLSAEEAYFDSKHYVKGLKIILDMWRNLRSDAPWLHATLRDYAYKVIRDEIRIDELTPVQLVMFGEAFHATHVGTLDSRLAEPLCRQLETKLGQILRRFHNKEAEGYILALRGIKEVYDHASTASDTLLKAEEELDKLGPSEILAHTQQILSVILTAIQKFDAGYRWALRSALTYEALGMKFDEANALNNAAAILFSLGKWDEAEALAKYLRDFYSRTEGYSAGKASSNGTLFEVNLYRRNFDDAEGYFIESNMNCLVTGEYGMWLNHIGHLLIVTIHYKGLDQSWPSKHAIYKYGVNLFSKVQTLYREQMNVHYLAIFSIQFNDRFKDNDEHGCKEVIDDLKQAIEQARLVAELPGSEHLLATLKSKYQTKFNL